MKINGKKLTAIILALTIAISMAAVGLTNVGAYADDSVSGAGNKVYFQVDSSLWKNYKNITCYIFPHNGGDAPITWGSKKGVMTYEGGDIWSFDFDEKGIYISKGKKYILK